MKFLELNALFSGRKRVVSNSESIENYYRLWKSKRDVFGEHTEYEAFIAGYTIGNNIILREKLMQEIGTQKVLDNKVAKEREAYNGKSIRK